MILLSMMMPPPTPVPSVTRITFLEPSAAPFHASPRAAILASLAAFAGRPVSALNSLATALKPQCRLTAIGTSPFSLTGPGIPIPTPSTLSFVIPLSSSFVLIASATSGRIEEPLFSSLVGISHCSTKVPFVRNRPHFTEVPPTSIPKQYIPIVIFHPF